MRKQIADPELRAKVTPDYTIGCKRILPSNKWYRALGQAQRRAGDRRRRARSARTRSSPRDGDGARGRRDHLRHRLPRHRHAGRHGWSAAATAGRSTRSGSGSPQAHLGTDDAGLPEPVPAARPEHRPRAPLDGLHDRVADRLRARRAARHGRARGADTVEVRARGGRSATTRDIDERMEGTVWNTRLRELVPRRARAATRRCGPTGRGASGSATARFDPADVRARARAAASREPVAA